MQSPRPGTPYHLLLRRPGAGWRLALVVPLCGIGLIVLAAMALLAVIVFAQLAGIDFTLDLEDGINAGEMFGTNLGLALLTPFSVLMVWAIYGVRPRWVSSNRPGFRWSWLWVCVGASMVVYALFLVLGTAGAIAERDAPIDATVVGFLGVVILTTPFQAAGEEYLFRGMLLQALGAARIPVWGCYVLSGLLFATAHLQFDPFLFADRFLLGVAFAYLAVETGGLEAPIAIHAVKNTSVLIPAALLEETDIALDPTDVTWIPVAIDLALLAIIVPWVLWLSRRRHGRRGAKAADQWAGPWQGPPGAPGSGGWATPVAAGSNPWSGQSPYGPPGAPPGPGPHLRPPGGYAQPGQGGPYGAGPGYEGAAPGQGGPYGAGPGYGAPYPPPVPGGPYPPPAPSRMPGPADGREPSSWPPRDDPAASPPDEDPPRSDETPRPRV